MAQVRADVGKVVTALDSDAKAEEKLLRERRLLVYGDMFGSAASYDNAITIAGYGAFFALWASINAALPIKSRAAIVITIGVSLLCYIGWQIAQMIFRQRSLIKRAEVLLWENDTEIYDQLWRENELDEQRGSMRLMAAWKYVLGLSVISGLLAAVYLVYCGLAVLFGLFMI